MLARLVIRDGAITDADDLTPQVLAFVDPDDREKALIAETLHLDDYDLASPFDPDEVARLEVAGDRAFILWKVPRRAQVLEAIELGVQPVALVLSTDRLGIVLSSGHLPFASREFRSIKDVRDVFLGFLLHTVRHYVGHLRAIKQLSADLEQKITVSMENRHLLQMFALGESLVYYLDALEGNGAVLSKLRSLSPQLGFSERQQQLLDDIVLENQQAARQAAIYSSVLSGLMDARGTIVNNNMNVLLKNLTLINVVFLPLNLIASIGGMSEWSMMTRGVDWRISYGVFLMGMVAFGWITWVLVRRIVEPKNRPAVRGGRH
jgi:magnesium transporter